MLRDGAFIKEQPVKIGAYYVRPAKHVATEEEYILQDALLQKESNDRINSMGLGMVAAGVAYLAIELVSMAVASIRK